MVTLGETKSCSYIFFTRPEIFRSIRKKIVWDVMGIPGPAGLHGTVGCGGIFPAQVCVQYFPFQTD